MRKLYEMLLIAGALCQCMYWLLKLAQELRLMMHS